MSSGGGLETLAGKSSCKHNAYTWTQSSHSQKEFPRYRTTHYIHKIWDNRSAETLSEYRPYVVGCSVLHNSPHKRSYGFINRFLASLLIELRPASGISATAIGSVRNC